MLTMVIPAHIRILAQALGALNLDRSFKSTKQEEWRFEVISQRLHTEWLGEGLDAAREIYPWAEALRESEPGKALMRVSHVPTAYDNILFFGGSAGGTEWFGLGIESRGLYVAYSGRWEFDKPRIIIRSANELAVFVHPVVLRAAVEWIANEKAWECIEKGFEYLGR